MELSKHLHPQTYWERRAELMEESVWRMANILAQALPAHYASMLFDHMRQWDDLIKEIEAKDQPPPNRAV